MDAAAVHAQQQQTAPATPTTASLAGSSAGGLPDAQSMMNTIDTQVHSHLNHTSRGPHKKRTASNAELDDIHSDGRTGSAHSNHLINGGGVLRVPMTGSTAAVSSSVVSSTTTSSGKGKATSASSGACRSSNSNSSSNGPLTEDEKKAERRAANRRSAFQSRQRRKILIEDLQRTVAALSKDNNDLRKNNDEIRSQLEAALLENRQLRQITSSLSAQAHAQVAAQQAQHQQQAAAGTQSQTTGSPTISAQAPPPIPSIAQQQPPSVAVASAAPPSFAAQSLNNTTAALTNFLNSFTSQTAGAPSSSEHQHHIFNAKIALMAAQSRVSELEHHQAAQAQAAANAAVAQQQQHQAQLQAQAQAAASAALGLAHVQAAAPGTTTFSDAQHLARLQEFLTRGITNASAAPAPPVPTAVAATSGAQTSAGISAAGVDLSHLRSLLEAQQQQQHAVAGVKATGPVSAPPESPVRGSRSSVPAKIETDKTSITNEAVTNTGGAPATVVAPQTSSSVTPAVSTGSSSSAVTANLAASQDAPGIQLLIKSLRAGQNGANGNSAAPPLDEAVRNYIKQQQLAQQQTSNAASAIKTEAK